MFITFPPVHRKTAAFLNLFVFRERLTGDSACLIPVPAAPPQSWCPSSSSPPPGRNHRGDWRSPTPKKAPAQRRRTPGCGTYPPGRRVERCSVGIPPGRRSRCRKRESEAFPASA